MHIHIIFLNYYEQGVFKLRQTECFSITNKADAATSNIVILLYDVNKHIFI